LEFRIGSLSTIFAGCLEIGCISHAFRFAVANGLGFGLLCRHSRPNPTPLPHDRDAFYYARRNQYQNPRLIRGVIGAVLRGAENAVTQFAGHIPTVDDRHLHWLSGHHHTLRRVDCVVRRPAFGARVLAGVEHLLPDPSVVDTDDACNRNNSGTID
jgi:hypothetical protein